MKLRSLLILVVVGLMVASCGNKGGKTGLLVPKDAVFVFHVNSASLSSKLSWDEIRQTNWFKMMSQHATDSTAKLLLADPAVSGIDTKSDFVAFMRKHGVGNYMVIEASLKNVDAYETMLKNIDKEHPKEIKRSGEFSYVEANDKGVVVWNKSMVAIVSNAKMQPGIASRMMPNRQMGIEDAAEFGNDSLRIFGQQALTLEGSNNLDADSRFADLIKDGSDAHLWFNVGSMASGVGANPMMSMMKVNLLLDNNVTAASINFENGKISVKAKHYASDEMNKISANYKPEAVTADQINRIPSPDAVAVLAFNYSPDALKETLKVTGLNTVADAVLAKVDFSIDDFVKANKGQVVLAITDLTPPANAAAGMAPFPKPDVKFLFATSVKDKASFEKMVTLAWDFSKQMKKNRPDSSMGPNMQTKPEISYKVQNDWFALSNSPDYTDKFLAGANNKFPFTDRITGHRMGLYVDLQKIFRYAASTKSSDSTEMAAINASLNTWQDIVATGGDYSGGSSTSQFEINFVDKNTNSLKQLNQYLDKLSQLKGMMHHGMAKIEPRDDGKMPPPPPAK